MSELIKVGDRVQVHNPAPGDKGVVMEINGRPATAAQAMIWWDDGSKSIALTSLLRPIDRPTSSSGKLSGEPRFTLTEVQEAVGEIVREADYSPEEAQRRVTAILNGFA